MDCIIVFNATFNSGFKWGSCCSLSSFLCSVLLTIAYHFVVFIFPLHCLRITVGLHLFTSIYKIFFQQYLSYILVCKFIGSYWSILRKILDLPEVTSILSEVSSIPLHGQDWLIYCCLTSSEKYVCNTCFHDEYKLPSFRRKESTGLV